MHPAPTRETEASNLKKTEGHRISNSSAFTVPEQGVTGLSLPVVHGAHPTGLRTSFVRAEWNFSSSGTYLSSLGLGSAFYPWGGREPFYQNEPTQLRPALEAEAVP